MNDPSKSPDRASRKRKTVAEQIAAAEEAQKKAVEALHRKKVKLQKYQSLQRNQARKLDTRKKIIAGALALEHMQFDGRYGAAFRALIDEYVTRDQDRALFGLPPLPDGDERRVSPPKIY